MPMVFTVCLLLLVSFPVSAAVHYSESAHGDSEFGVFRAGLDDYAVGNCGHCHEQHASLLDGVAQDSLVYSQTDQTVSGSYTVDDNFAFSVTQVMLLTVIILQHLQVMRPVRERAAALRHRLWMLLIYRIAMT